jgi:dihydroorotate dehydrogenase
MNLSTTYLGLRLKNPLAIGSCPLTQEIDVLRRAEEAGAAAVVLPSLFEEQIEYTDLAMCDVRELGAERLAPLPDDFGEPHGYYAGPGAYLESIREAKRAVSIPLIASLNGTTKGGWVRYARLIEEEGADVAMIASVLYQRRIEYVETILHGLKGWMGEKEFDSVDQYRGMMSQMRCPDPVTFERANYLMVLNANSRTSTSSLR